MPAASDASTPHFTCPSADWRCRHQHSRGSASWPWSPGRYPGCWSSSWMRDSQGLHACSWPCSCEPWIFNVSLTLCAKPRLCEQLVYLPGSRLAWSQQGFWQLSFCRKRNFWSLCFYGRTKVKFFCIALIKKVKWRQVHFSSFHLLDTSPLLQESSE